MIPRPVRESYQKYCMRIPNTNRQRKRKKVTIKRTFKSPLT